MSQEWRHDPQAAWPLLLEHTPHHHWGLQEGYLLEPLGACQPLQAVWSPPWAIHLPAPKSCPKSPSHYPGKGLGRTADSTSLVTLWKNPGPRFFSPNNFIQVSVTLSIHEPSKKDGHPDSSWSVSDMEKKVPVSVSGHNWAPAFPSPTPSPSSALNQKVVKQHQTRIPQKAKQDSQEISPVQPSLVS